MHISRSTPPVSSLIQKSSFTIHYQDSFKTEFNCTKQLHVQDLVYAFFDSSPKWIENLFELRNKIVRLCGLKVSELNNRQEQRKRFRVEKGNSLGLFQVFEKDVDEVLLGEDDKHLDFRILFHLTKTGDNVYVFSLTTPVRFNNLFGKIYFSIIKPFHKFIVPAMMKSIIKEVTK